MLNVPTEHICRETRRRTALRVGHDAVSVRGICTGSSSVHERHTQASGTSSADAAQAEPAIGRWPSRLMGGLAGRLAVRRRLRRALWGGLGGDGSSWGGEARGATCQPPRAAVGHGQPPAPAGASAAARATRQAPYLTCDAACYRARVGGVSCLGNLPSWYSRLASDWNLVPPVVGGLSHAMSFRCCDTQIPVDASLPLALPPLKKRLLFDCCCIVRVH